MSELVRQDVPTTRPWFELSLDDTSVDLGWSGCGRWLAAATAGGAVHIVDTAGSASHCAWFAHEGSTMALSWHPSQPLLATSGQDGAVRLWRITGQQPDVALAETTIGKQPGARWVEHLAWRPDGKQLAAACGNVVWLLAADGTTEAEHAFPGGTVGALCWRPKGAQLAVAGYGGVQIHNVLDPDSRPRKLHWKGSLLSLSWSPDTQVIAAGCQDNTVHFWRMPQLRDAVMSGFDYKPLQLCWSKNSRWLVTGASRQLILWPFDQQGPEGRSPVSRDFHPAAICAISVASAGPQLATGCRAGLLAIWRRLGDSAPARAAQLTARVEQLAWSPRKGSRQLASTSRDAILNLWQVDD